MSIVLQSTGGGQITLLEPTTASNFTQTLPAATGTVALTSNIPAAYTNANVLTLFSASGSAPVFACRAFVNFNGTGTVAIRASGNVSSITDFSVGNYGVNFTTSMPDTNYAAATGVGDAVTDGIQGSARTGSFNTGNIQLGVTNPAGTAFVDNAVITCTIFR